MRQEEQAVSVTMHSLPELRRRLLDALGPVKLGSMNALCGALRVMPLIRSQRDLVDPEPPGWLRGWGD